MKFEWSKSDYQIPEARKKFLDNVYLGKEYIVDKEVGKRIRHIIERLLAEYPGFFGMTLAGGLCNGSYVLRRIENPKAKSDIDFYLIGDNTLPSLLTEISKRIIEAVDLHPDGVLNGKDVDYYLNLDQIPAHISRGDFDLLKLPFECFFGKRTEAQNLILAGIDTHPDKQSIWEEIRRYHSQTLSMHHSSWDDEFNGIIYQAYYPRKVKKFALPRLQSLVKVGR